MKAVSKFFYLFIIAALISILFSSFFNDHQPGKVAFNFPYKKAGLSSRQAAAHLLSRFTYGATPGQIDAVVEMGLEKWFQQQLAGSLPDDPLNQMLEGYETLKMSNAEIVSQYPRKAQVLKMAIKDGVIDKDSVNKADKDYKQQLAAYMQKQGLKPQQELFRQFINQKILRAAFTNNQLQEVLTDFWFNHFNVSMTKNDCAEFIPAYERDIIRPNVFGRFENLLIATAKSPAMLLYLDNFSSSGVNSETIRKAKAVSMEAPKDDSLSIIVAAANKQLKGKKLQGLNENYAREVMELHTLGVDGGYTQQDVTEAARVLTGWTIFPIGQNGYGNAVKKLIEKVGEDKLRQHGFVHEGDFMFAVNRHDNKEKKVLGKIFPANGGYEEGLQLLKMLSGNPATARFISKKLAVRFVTDDPPKALVDKLSKIYLDKQGDIRQMLITIVSSPEFWSSSSVREKTKSPFELAISAVRSLNADIKQPYQLYNWITKMGQKMYFYQAPTGFPDKGQYWINTGALLNRMNFGLALATQRIPGTSFNLAALNNNREPESSEAALVTYSKIMMPERNLDETVKRLTPLLNDPELVKKVDEAADKTPVPSSVNMNAIQSEDAMMMNDEDKEKTNKESKKKSRKNNTTAMQTFTGNNSMLSQVVGIIIGSPEFQRR